MYGRTLFIAIAALLFSHSTLTANNAKAACFKNIENTFFDPNVVMLAFQYFQVPQGSWYLVATELRNRNSIISKRMSELGNKMRPNPLRYPFDEKGAVKLLRRVTREIFMDAMRKYDPTPIEYRGIREQYWANIYDYIFDVEMERINDCLGNS